MTSPEELARINIGRQLIACGWVIQDMAKLNRYMGLGAAVHKFLGGEI
jgi:type I restriction enzyme R subunit